MGPRLIVLIHAYFIKISHILRHPLIHLLMRHVLDLFDQLLLINSIKRIIKITYTKYYAAQTPYISSRVIFTPIKHFWCLISQSTNVFDHWNSKICKSSCDSKITNLHRIIFIFKEYVARLEISVHYLDWMQILYCNKHF